MARIIIDNREIEVSDGIKVIEAAERLGIMIPRFCYHPALGPVGACRVCAVKFLEGPVKGIQMSCMVAAKDGMVVSTTDEEAMDFRKHVVEWLMLNHPHDCPVCDEGGHCLLQDLTVSGGHAIRRYEGLKRTYPDQDLGPLLRHEMNRCIHCYRCARFYKEFTGYFDLGVLGSANRTYFGRFQGGGALESPFAGNLADICPTGVFTDRPSRFKGRKWDYERRPSLCIHCSLGCHIHVSARYREIVRQEARQSEPVNGYFICDRGRYGFYYANLDSRPRNAVLEGKPASWLRAATTATEKLAKIIRDHGPKAVALSASTRCSIETQTAAKRLCREQGFTGPAFFLSDEQALKTRAAVAGCELETAVSLGDIPSADYILVAGADPINEAPMLALAIRQAVRNRAEVVVMDSRPISMPFAFEHLPTSPDELQRYLMVLSDGNVRKGTDVPLPAIVQSLSEKLVASRRPIIVCGTDAVPPEVPQTASKLAAGLKSKDRNPGVFFLLPGSNAFGAILLSDGAGNSLETVIEKIEAGTVRALVLVETDPHTEFPDRERLDRAISKLDYLVALDYIDSKVSGTANVFLPTTTLYESGGLYVNQEGRLQHASAVYQGGLPVSRTGRGSHPPRRYDAGLPGAVPKPAWKALGELHAGLSHSREDMDRHSVLEWLSREIPVFSDPPLADLPEDGARLGVPAAIVAAVGAAQSPKGGGGESGFELLLSDLTFGTETLSSFSACLHGMEAVPHVILNSEDAKDLGLENGDQVKIQLKTGSIELALRTAESAARGVCILPRHRLVAWQRVGTGRAWVEKNRITPCGRG